MAASNGSAGVFAITKTRLLLFASLAITFVVPLRMRHATSWGENH